VSFAPRLRRRAETRIPVPVVHPRDYAGPTTPTLSMDLTRPDAVPYFLWDEPMTIDQLRERLAQAPEEVRVRLLGKILREARDPDVWRFVTPADVVRLWPKLVRQLGRRRPFWEFLLARWQEAGLVSSR
jgi:hypothetical protein